MAIKIIDRRRPVWRRAPREQLEYVMKDLLAAAIKFLPDELETDEQIVLEDRIHDACLVLGLSLVDIERWERERLLAIADKVVNASREN